MSRPTVLDPPKPGNLAITPTPETAQRSVLRTAEGKPCGWTVRSSAVPGDVPERGYLRVGPHRGFASDAGVGTEDSPCPDSGPRTYDRARGDPAPCPHLRVPIHHGPRSQKTVAPHGRIGMHGHTRRDDATTPDRGDARDVCERMYGREELSSKAPQGVGNPQPGGVVRDRHYNVYRLDREHALEHLDVPKDRIPSHPLRDRRVGVVVKPEHAISQPTSQQNVQRDPSVAASSYNGDSHLFIEGQPLHLDFGFRHAGSGFGLSYLPHPQTEIAPSAPGSLASLPTGCSHTPHHHALAHCDYAKYRCLGYRNAPSRELPSRKSRAGSRRPPGTWSSSTSRQPFPQYTAIRPFSASMCPASEGTAARSSIAERQILTGPSTSGWNVLAPMCGARALIRLCTSPTSLPHFMILSPCEILDA